MRTYITLNRERSHSQKKRLQKIVLIRRVYLVVEIDMLVVLQNMKTVQLKVFYK